MTQKIISIVNRHRSVGKTTLAIGLADAFLSEHRCQVCLVDLDPQACASQVLLPAEEFDRRLRSDLNLHGLLLARLSGEDPELCDHRRDVLRFIKTREALDVRLYPNSHRLWDLQERELRLDGGTRLSNAVKRVLRQEAEDGRIVIVDCPPGQSVSALAAIQGSDLVLCPVTPDRLAIWGKELLTEYLKDYAPRTRRRFVVTRATSSWGAREASRALERLAQDPEMLKAGSAERLGSITRLSEHKCLQHRRLGPTHATPTSPLRKIYGRQGSRELTTIVNALRRELDNTA